MKDDGSFEVQKNGIHPNESNDALTKQKNINFNINYINNKAKILKISKYQATATNSYESYFDYDFDTLTIECPQNLLLFILYMNGLEAKVYEFDEDAYDMNLVSTITEKSPLKIIYYKKSKWRIVIEKLQTSSKIIKSDEPILYFAYFNVGRAEEYYETECDDIYISTNPYFEYFIRQSIIFFVTGEEKINYTLSNRKTFCLWLTCPLSIVVLSSSYLPHRHIVYKESTRSSTGNSLFYMLIKSNSTNNTQYAKYYAVAVWASLVDKYANYAKYSAFFKGGQSSDNEGDGNSGNNNDDQNSNPKNIGGLSTTTIIIIAVVAVVVILVV